MNKFINMLALAAFACATVPTHALAGEPESEQAAAAPKKKSGFLSFAKRVAEQVAPQVLPQNGSLKAIAGQVALSAVQQSDGGDVDARPRRIGRPQCAGAGRAQQHGRDDEEPWRSLHDRRQRDDGRRADLLNGQRCCLSSFQTGVLHDL